MNADMFSMMEIEVDKKLIIFQRQNGHLESITGMDLKIFIIRLRHLNFKIFLRNIIKN